MRGNWVTWLALVVVFPAAVLAADADPQAAMQKLLLERRGLYHRLEGAIADGHEDEAFQLAEQLRPIEQQILAQEVAAPSADKEDLNAFRLGHAELLNWLAQRYQRQGDLTSAASAWR